MDDLISRRAAIDALVKRTHLTWEHLKVIYPMLDVFEELPSAERRGKWESIVIGGEVWGTQCSECHAIDLYGKPAYCPNCGSKMDLSTDEILKMPPDDGSTIPKDLWQMDQEE